MERCPACGSVIQAKDQYCPSCGNIIIKKRLIQKIPDLAESPKLTETGEKKSGHKKRKWPKILLVIGILCGCGLAVFFIQNELSPYKQLNMADEAFLAKDYEIFASYFKFDSNVMIAPKGFHQFMEEQQWSQQIRENITNNLKEMQQSKLSEVNVRNASEIILFTIKKKPKWLFFHEYQWEIEGIEVMGKALNHQMTISYGKKLKKRITADGYTKIGLFLPGKYQFTARIKDDFGQQEVKYEKVVELNEQREQLFDFSLNAYTTTVNADYEEAIVFINSQSTNTKVKDFISYTLPKDGTVSIFAETKVANLVEQSEMAKITTAPIYLEFPSVTLKKEELVSQLNEEQLAALLKQHIREVEAFYKSFREEYEYALNFISWNALDTYFAEGTEARSSIKKFVERHADIQTYQYDFLTNTITDMSMLDEKTIDLRAIETFNSYSSRDGNWYYERVQKYIIKLNNGAYKIQKLEDVEDIRKREL